VSWLDLCYRYIPDSNVLEANEHKGFVILLKTVFKDQ
jgi:hypothetical protein